MITIKTLFSVFAQLRRMQLNPVSMIITWIADVLSYSIHIYSTSVSKSPMLSVSFADSRLHPLYHYRNRSLLLFLGSVLSLHNAFETVVIYRSSNLLILKGVNKKRLLRKSEIEISPYRSACFLRC